jgi:hypothetical protein
MIDFLRHKALSKTEARELYPHIADAFDIYNSNQIVFGHRWVIEAYLMTDATNTYIAQKYDFHSKGRAIAIYRKLFFDIDPYRHLKECVLGNVLCLSIMNNKEMEDSDFGWKSYAYKFGKTHFSRLLDFHLGGDPLTVAQRAHFTQLLEDRVLYASSQSVLHMKRMHLEQIGLLTSLNSRISSGGRFNKESDMEELASGVSSILDAFSKTANSDHLEKHIASNTGKHEKRLDVDYNNFPK